MAKLAGRSGGPGWSGDRAPRTVRELAQVLADRPEGWEYLSFGGVLYMALEPLEDKYRDHEMRYAPPSGEQVGDDRASAYLRQALDDIRLLVQRIGAVMQPAIQERAFGAQGAAGDPERIRHLATRLNDIYADLLKWAARLHGAGRSARCGPAFELLARAADLPLQRYREFTDRLLQEIDRLPHRIAAGERVSLELSLVVAVDEELLAQVARQLQRLSE